MALECRKIFLIVKLNDYELAGTALATPLVGAFNARFGAVKFLLVTKILRKEQDLNLRSLAG